MPLISWVSRGAGTFLASEGTREEPGVELPEEILPVLGQLKADPLAP